MQKKNNENLHRVAFITGANHGIGLELTRKMLAENWQVIALIRSAYPDDDALIREAVNSKQLRIFNSDLTDFVSLKAALKEIKSRETRIDLLFNNAGGSFPELSYSKQGREMHFELQTVVPYIIMTELKDLLHQGTLKTVINTSSNAFLTLKTFDPGKLEHPTAFKKLFGPYSTTKLALSLWTQELAPHLAAEGIMIRSADPGGNNTIRRGKKSGLPVWLKPVIRLFFPHPSYGADLLYKAAMGQHSRTPGAYLTKDQVTPLKFPGESRKVLAMVQAIYEKEFNAL